LTRHHLEIVKHIKQVAKGRAIENQEPRRNARVPRAKSSAAKKESEAQ
jgi:hypothetical protein